MSETFDFDRVRTNVDLADALGKLKEDLARARDAGQIDADACDDAELSLSQAIREAHMPAPSKPTLIDHLDDARDRMADNPAVGALSAALARAREAAQSIP
jgi:hypothetical protein